MEPRRSYRVLAWADAFANRIYTDLEAQSAVPQRRDHGRPAGVLLVTGVYLLLFYRLGAPYESVARLNDQVWRPLDPGAAPLRVGRGGGCGWGARVPHVRAAAELGPAGAGVGERRGAAWA
jgi:hypothetical protein